MQVSNPTETQEVDQKPMLCRVYAFTGNCPFLSSCHYRHDTPFKTETKQTDAAGNQSKPKPKPLKKPGTKQGDGNKFKEFKPPENGTSDLKDFLDKAHTAEEEEKINEFDTGFNDHDDYDDEVFLDNGGDEIEYIGRDNAFFYEVSKDCQCCKGHVYNCSGETCMLLGSCFCYEMEASEKLYAANK